MVTSIVTYVDKFHVMLLAYGHPYEYLTSLIMKNFKHLVNSELTKSIENHDKLSAYVCHLMHIDTQKHNVWAVTRRNQLSLMTDNPYLATQLNYQQSTIRDAINRKFLLQLKTVKVKIIPPSSTPPKRKQDLYTIGSKAGEILASIANDIEDEGLKSSLLKLAKQNNKKG